MGDDRILPVTIEKGGGGVGHMAIKMQEDENDNKPLLKRASATTEGIQRRKQYLLPGLKLGVHGTLFSWMLKAVTFIYDCLTFPIFYHIQKPSKKILAHEKMKAELTSFEDGSATWQPNLEMTVIQKEMVREKVDTMDKLFTFSIKKYGLQRCLGNREMISEEDEIQSDGKVFKKCTFDSYTWKSFIEVDRIALDFSTGLVSLGLDPKDKICIYAETRIEWFLALIAAFKRNFTIVTLYATLGDEAVIHGIRETESKIVLTSSELLPKLKHILPHTPKVEHIVYMEHPLKNADNELVINNKIGMHTFNEVIQKGKTSRDIPVTTPTADDVAVIMYTSGSTGQPKGVMLTQRNILAGLIGLLDGLGPVTTDDVYMAYLPLAHVFEMLCECVSFLHGVRIGYSSPLTVTDKSAKIKTGTKGDASVLNPTVMISVPFAMDRIYKGVLDQVGSGSVLKKALFFYFYDYKLKWYYRGYSSPLTDALIFKKARMLLGGKVRLILTGGAPLADATFEFLRNCFSIPIVQGYGLTESSSCATATTIGDMTVGRVGPPLRGCQVRLIDWEEGGYFVNDFPNPRGEIVIGGDNISIGYYKMAVATQQDYFVEGGKRWFRTGDIGEVDTDGVFRIIDRKKDLIKLQMGEYLSLGKVESTLKTCPYVENIWVHGDPMEKSCVAVVVPAQKALESVVGYYAEGDKLAELCATPEVESAFLKEIQRYGLSAKLQKFEIPQAVRLCSEIWTPDTGLVTGAFKVRRKNLLDRYRPDINKMYFDLRNSVVC